MARSLLSEMKDGRNQLHSGIVRVTGTAESHSSNGTITIRKTEGFCCFDDAMAKFRFDRATTIGGKELLNSTENSPPHVRLRKWKYVKAPDYSIHTEGDDTVVRIHKPDAKLSHFTQPFDVRVIGLVNYTELFIGMQRLGDKFSCDGVFAFYEQKHQLQSVVELENGILQLTWVYGSDDHSERRLWIDSKRGYTPVRMEVRNKAKQGNAYQEDPVVISVVKWKEIHGVWVPVTLSLESYYNHDELEMTFDWETVNESVPDVLFSVEGMDLPKGRYLEPSDGQPAALLQTVVYDHRPDKTVLVSGGDAVEESVPIQQPDPVAR